MFANKNEERRHHQFQAQPEGRGHPTSPPYLQVTEILFSKETKCLLEKYLLC